MKNKLLNLALKYPDKIDYINEIIGDANYIEALQGVSKVWKKTGKTPTLKTISDSYKLEAETIELQEGDILWLIEEYNKVAKEFIISDLITKNDDGKLSLDSIYASWETRIIDIEPPNIITSSSANDILSDIENMKQRQEDRIDTGFAQFNELLTKNGSSGWAKKYCYLLQGLTGTGKTFFLSNIAVRAMMQGLKVAFVSIEMDQWQIRDLIYRSYFNVSNIQDIKTKISTALDFELTVLNYSNMSHNMIDIQSDLNKLSNKPDVVIIDYLDNIAPSTATRQSWEVHQVVSTDMSRVAQEMDVPIITATQTNRNAAGDVGGTKRNVGYESTGSSFNKTQVFAGIWSIITDDNDYDEVNECRNFELVCNKNREGKQTKTKYTLNYHNAKLYEPHELNINTKKDSFAKQAAVGRMNADIGLDKESKDEQKETLSNFNKYYNQLKDDPDYKSEVDDIDSVYLDRHQRSKLKKKIEEYQFNQKDIRSILGSKK